MVINWLKQICELILVSELCVEALKPISPPEKMQDESFQKCCFTGLLKWRSLSTLKYLGMTKEFYQRGFWKSYSSLNGMQPNRCSEERDWLTKEALSGLPKEGLIEKLLSLVKLAFPSWRPVNQHFFAVARILHIWSWREYLGCMAMVTGM